MEEKKKPNEHSHSIFDKIELSGALTFIGIVVLFSLSIIVVLIAPRYVDSTWISPTSPYQVMMYEISDPNMYISSSRKGSTDLEFVQHLKEDFSLLAFREESNVRIIAPPELEKYVTRINDPVLKLTSRILFLRKPIASTGFNGAEEEEKLRKQLQSDWEKEHPKWKEEKLLKVDFNILELYAFEGKEAFSIAETEGEFQSWVDEKFAIIEGTNKQPFHQYPGVIYTKNPKEYKVTHFKFGAQQGWRYDPNGKPVKNLEELKSTDLGFLSRKELIEIGENIYKIEGCWYCHTDQTRTLVQDLVLNGSESFPAPPSSPNEYIYQKVTFMGTRRIGPDLSRVGVKRPSRDWHKGHFWFPKTASPGSIMPTFRHFFDNDPRGTSKSPYGIPNYKFEAIFQYLMTKGTRITSPTEAWWLGKDPIQTIEIIEGRKKLE